jgi:hypothetical protein
MKTHIISKSDLTEYAVHDLGLWNTLTGDMGQADEIEVQVLRVTRKGKAVR